MNKAITLIILVILALTGYGFYQFITAPKTPHTPQEPPITPKPGATALPKFTDTTKQEQWEAFQRQAQYNCADVTAKVGKEISSDTPAIRFSEMIEGRVSTIPVEKEQVFECNEILYVF